MRIRHAAAGLRRALLCAAAALVVSGSGGGGGGGSGGGGASVAQAQLLRQEHPAETLGAGVTEKRGGIVPVELEFTDAQGKARRLGEFFDGQRPVVLVLGYFDCPLLCTAVFNGAQKAFNEMKFDLGEEYTSLAVSFDHTNTTSDAAVRQAAMLAGYRDEMVDESAWPFLTATAANARSLADSVGYEYVYMPKADEYSHAAVIIVLSPDGAVSNYLYGVKYEATQLQMALSDAAQNRIGSVFDRILFFCHVVGSDGKYSLHAMRVMQVAGTLSVIVVGTTLGLLFLNDARRKARRGRQAVAAGASARPALQA